MFNLALFGYFDRHRSPRRSAKNLIPTNLNLVSDVNSLLRTSTDLPRSRLFNFAGLMSLMTWSLQFEQNITGNLNLHEINVRKSYLTSCARYW